MSIRNPIFIINKSISLLSPLHLPQVVVLDRLQNQVGHGVVAYRLILVLVLHLRRVDPELIFVTNIINYICGEKNCHMEKFWEKLKIFGRFCHNLRTFM